MSVGRGYESYLSDLKLEDEKKYNEKNPIVYDENGVPISAAEYIYYCMQSITKQMEYIAHHKDEELKLSHCVEDILQKIVFSTENSEDRKKIKETFINYLDDSDQAVLYRATVGRNLVDDIRVPMFHGVMQHAFTLSLEKRVDFLNSITLDTTSPLHHILIASDPKIIITASGPIKEFSAKLYEQLNIAQAELESESKAMLRSSSALGSEKKPSMKDLIMEAGNAKGKIQDEKVAALINLLENIKPDSPQFFEFNQLKFQLLENKTLRDAFSKIRNKMFDKFVELKPADLKHLQKATDTSKPIGFLVNLHMTKKHQYTEKRTARREKLDELIAKQKLRDTRVASKEGLVTRTPSSLGVQSPSKVKNSNAPLDPFEFKFRKH